MPDMFNWISIYLHNIICSENPRYFKGAIMRMTTVILVIWSIHYVEKIWIIANFIEKKSFDLKVLVTSTGYWCRYADQNIYSSQSHCADLNLWQRTFFPNRMGQLFSSNPSMTSQSVKLLFPFFHYFFSVWKNFVYHVLRQSSCYLGLYSLWIGFASSNVVVGSVINLEFSNSCFHKVHK